MLTRFVRQVGKVVEFQTGKGASQKNWAKLNFEIEVAEIGGHSYDDTQHQGGTFNTEPSSHTHQELEDGMMAQGDEVAVTIDPEEHQSYAWATEEQIRDGQYTVATHAQRELMIQAFDLRRAEAEEMEAMAAGHNHRRMH